MGRKNKKKRYIDPIISELKEREKIKQSVLQVFRNRLASPGGGGGILVGKENTVKSNKPSESSSSMTDSEVSSSPGRKTQKRRRRRKKHKTQKKVKKAETDRHDVAKHLKIAHDARKTIHPAGDVTKVSLISQNRLTKKIGLFNRGKKSSTISRDMSDMFVPESVKKKTQEDLKKILQHSDHEDEENCMNDTQPAIITISPLPCLKTSTGPATAVNSNRKSDMGYHSGKSNPITPASQKIKANTSSTSCISTASSEDVRDFLPEEIQMDNISEILIRRLNLKQFFPGRNLFEETVEDLRKIMKQNSFATTPMSKKLKTKDVDSVKRKLLDRYSPTKNRDTQNQPHRPTTNKPESVSTIPPYKTFTNKSESVSTLPRSPGQQKHQKNVHKVRTPMEKSNDTSLKSSLRNVGEDFLSMFSQSPKSGRGLVDGRTLLEFNDIHTNSRPSSARYDSCGKIVQSPSKPYKRELPDGKTLLRCNDDKLIAETCQQMEQLSSKPQAMEADLARGNALKLLERNEKAVQHTKSNHSNTSYIREIQRDILSLLPNDLDRTQQSSQSSGYHGSQNSKYIQEEYNNRQIVRDTVNDHDQDYMPKFHSQASDDVSGSQYKENRCVDMDILDYLDDPPTELRIRKQKNPKHLISASPDSDSIPVWLPSNVHVLILPKKPTFASPSPEKLRPRFMH